MRAAALLLALLTGCARPAPAKPGDPAPRSWVQDLVDGIKTAQDVACNRLPRFDPDHAPNRLAEAVGDVQVVLCKPGEVP